jgi:hypothetical protein
MLEHQFSLEAMHGYELSYFEVFCHTRITRIKKHELTRINANWAKVVFIWFATDCTENTDIFFREIHHGQRLGRSSVKIRIICGTKIPVICDKQSVQSVLQKKVILKSITLISFRPA